MPLVWIAATLGTTLGPDWTADLVARFITGQRRGRPLLAAPSRPVAYLRTLLRAALTSGTEPPSPARCTVEHRRAAAAAETIQRQRAQRATRAERDARTAAAVPGQTNSAVQALRQRWTGADWPAERPAGGGLPAGWRRGQDQDGDRDP